MGYLLHVTYQNQGMEPGILLGIRTHNERIPAGERAFLLASTRKAILDGDTPVKISNFTKQKGGAVQNGK